MNEQSAVAAVLSEAVLSRIAAVGRMSFEGAEGEILDAEENVHEGMDGSYFRVWTSDGRTFAVLVREMDWKQGEDFRAVLGIPQERPASR